MSTQWPEESEIDDHVLAGEPAHCKRCKSSVVVKRGVEKGNQRYQCKKCLLKFFDRG